jgi:hypothetical protein
MTLAYRARVGPLVTRSMTPIRSLRTGAYESGSWGRRAETSAVLTGGRIARSRVKRASLLTLANSMRNGEPVPRPPGDFRPAAPSRFRTGPSPRRPSRREPGRRRASRRRASGRFTDCVSGSSRSSLRVPRAAVVVVVTPSLKTPRISMQRCRASTETMSPTGLAFRRFPEIHSPEVGFTFECT